jgi:hypothetical protein
MDAVLVYVQSAATAHEAWMMLCKMYKPSGPLSIVLIQREVYQLHLEEGSSGGVLASVEDALQKLRGWQAELVMLGNVLSLDEFSICLLAALPESWDPFIQTVDVMQLANNMVLVAWVLKQGWRMTKLSTTASDRSTALAAAANARSKPKPKHAHPGRNKNGKRTCYTCGSTEHLSTWHLKS